MSPGDRVAAGAVPPGAAPRPPWIVWVGLAVVLAAAAALSFDALRALALAVGIPARFAWLLPVAVDAGAAVSCATWLGGRTTPEAARFAGRMTWALLGVTVVGNAGQLGMHHHGITPPWWVAALVGAIAPAVVGSTVHLVVLLVRRSAPSDDPVRTTSAAPSDDPVRATVEVVREPVRTVPDVAAIGPSGRPTSHPFDTRPAERNSGPSEIAQDARPGPDQQYGTPDGPFDESADGPDPLLDEVARWASDRDGRPSATAVRTTFRVGRDRAVRLLDQLDRTTTETGRTTAHPTGR